jgi:hypothetical protein
MKKAIFFITPIIFIFSFFILNINKPSYLKKLAYCTDSIEDASLQKECLSNLLLSSLEKSEYVKLTDKIESSYKQGVLDKNLYKLCHSISHQIGSSLVDNHLKSFDMISNIFTNNCEQGLAHGLFENITKSDNEDFLAELLRICNSVDNYLGCAHGYGHYLVNNYPDDKIFIKCNNFNNITFIPKFKYECGYGIAMSLWSPVDLLGNSLDNNKNKLLEDNLINNNLSTFCNIITDISIRSGCSSGLGFSYKEYLTISSYQEAYSNIKKYNNKDHKSFLEFYLTLPNYKLINKEILDELLLNLCKNDVTCVADYINFINNNIPNYILNQYCSQNKLLTCNKSKNTGKIIYDNNAEKYFKICSNLVDNIKGCEKQLFINFKDLYYINDLQYKQICNKLALSRKENDYCNKILFES